MHAALPANNRTLKTTFKESFEQGFTVIELLVALSILTLVLAAAFSLFSAGLKSSNSAFAKTEACQNARFALDAMVKELLYADSYSVHRGGAEIRFTVPHDQFRTRRFRLENGELIFDAYPTGCLMYFHNKIALGLNRLNFSPGAGGLILIELETGPLQNPFKLKGAVLPRNLAGLSCNLNFKGAAVKAT